jgi:hypothetical protein
LLYRWGNPLAYGAGSRADQQLAGQHDAQWIDSDLAGQDRLLIFNNGSGRGYSSVDEIVPPVDEGGHYLLEAEAYGPDAPTWSYVANTPEDFFAPKISGAQRLVNGNTLICSGPEGRFFEITEAGETVWEYINPVTPSGPLAQGEPVPTDSGPSNQVFRARRFALDDPFFADLELIPGETLEAP